MILRFLRLFSAFRALEVEAQAHRDEADFQRREVQRENAAKIAAIERNRDLEADNLQLRTDLQAAQGKAVHSTEMVADFLSQQMFGKRIYAQAPALPEQSQEAEIIQRPRSQARVAVDEQTRAFYEQWAAQQATVEQ